MTLSKKISALTVSLTIFTLAVTLFISGRWTIDQMVDSLARNTKNAVVITAQSPILRHALKKGVDDGSVQPYLKQIQSSLEQIDIMVVADAKRIRYGHTKSDRVGKQFSALDHDRALEKGETYVSTGPGTLGDSMRAFAPIKDENGQILGFVMAGTLLDSIAKAKKDILTMAFIYTLLGSAIAILCAVFLSRYIKKSLLHHEPEDIARLYLENQGVLATIHEGVLAINRMGTITLINEAAKTYLELPKNPLGEAITEVFPLCRLPEVLKEERPILDVSYALGSRLVLSNNIPLYNEAGELVGGVASFRDHTKVTRLAEEITGVQKMVDALRATTHEFKNKLHVILGLLETDQTERAKAYIARTGEALQIMVSHILNHVAEPTVAALLIGKSQRCQELSIDFKLHEESEFANRCGFDPNALVVILGNLIDNAADCLDTLRPPDPRIDVFLQERGEELLLWVADSAGALNPKDPLFQKGFTTKQGARGYGLSLVLEQVHRYHGSATPVVSPGVLTRWDIRLKGDRP
ncbi:Two-component sensor histidine kinase, malate [Clostridiaceae bacterium JG1575]|nr:Two-component sensor histidine kinase, malate [Clostridiaceae bacterium JG1575]